MKEVAILDTIIESVDDIIFLINDHYIILDVWTGKPSQLWMPQQNFINKSIGEAYPSEIAELIGHNIDKTLTTKEKT